MKLNNSLALQLDPKRKTTHNFFNYLFCFLLLGYKQSYTLVQDEPKLANNSGVVSKRNLAIEDLIFVCEISTPFDANIVVSSKKLIICVNKKENKNHILVKSLKTTKVMRRGVTCLVRANFLNLLVFCIKSIIICSLYIFRVACTKIERVC